MKISLSLFHILVFFAPVGFGVSEINVQSQRRLITLFFFDKVSFFTKTPKNTNQQIIYYCTQLWHSFHTKLGA